MAALTLTMSLHPSFFPEELYTRQKRWAGVRAAGLALRAVGWAAAGSAAACWLTEPAGMSYHARCPAGPLLQPFFIKLARHPVHTSAGPRRQRPRTGRARGSGGRRPRARPPTTWHLESWTSWQSERTGCGPAGGAGLGSTGTGVCQQDRRLVLLRLAATLRAWPSVDAVWCACDIEQWVPARGWLLLALAAANPAPPWRLPQGAGAAGRGPGGKAGGKAGEEEEAPPEEIEEEEEDVPEDDDYYQARWWLVESRVCAACGFLAQLPLGRSLVCSSGPPRPRLPCWGPCLRAARAHRLPPTSLPRSAVGCFTSCCCRTSSLTTMRDTWMTTTMAAAAMTPTSNLPPGAAAAAAPERWVASVVAATSEHRCWWPS